MRKRIVAGNWKMNKNLDEALEFAMSINEHRSDIPVGVSVIVAPPALYLYSMEVLEEPVYQLAAQNCSHHNYGAFTGEISPAMLDAMKIPYCIIGHSERRQYFHETDELLAKKAVLCLEHEITPIWCCGETIAERQDNKHFVTVLHQLEKSLFGLTAQQMSRVVVAYEPVWAIGTGVTATTEQAQEMHAFIRRSLADHFGEQTADQVTILYGGSVNAANSAELFACPDVDGGLVGGASLKVKDFLQIIASAAL